MQVQNFVPKFQLSTSGLLIVIFACGWSFCVWEYLPPVSEGWGKIIISLCVSVRNLTGGGEGRYPIPGLDLGGDTPSRSGQWGRGTLSQVWMMGGTPLQPALDGVPPPPRSALDGVTPCQDWMGTTPTARTGWGIPPELDGVPPLHPGLDGVRSGRYASCVHAGGLSCCKDNS